MCSWGADVVDCLKQGADLHMAKPRNKRLSGSTISWAMCKSAPCFRQTTTVHTSIVVYIFTSLWCVWNWIMAALCTAIQEVRIHKCWSQVRSYTQGPQFSTAKNVNSFCWIVPFPWNKVPRRFVSCRLDADGILGQSSWVMWTITVSADTTCMHLKYNSWHWYSLQLDLS